MLLLFNPSSLLKELDQQKLSNHCSPGETIMQNIVCTTAMQNVRKFRFHDNYRVIKKSLYTQITDDLSKNHENQNEIRSLCYGKLEYTQTMVITRMKRNLMLKLNNLDML